MPVLPGMWISEQVAIHPYMFCLVLGVGVFTLTRFLLKTLLVLTQTFVLPGKSLNSFGTPKGTWAVITGASDGIGKEFALQLAAAGFNILLVARNEVALAAVAAEIESKTAGNVETQIQLTDFARKDSTSLNALRSTIRGLKVGILVNNVGKVHSRRSYFVETVEQETEDIVTINIMATLRVTRAVLPGMIQRKRGLILNVGSFAGQIPVATLATYSGTKAFVSTFTSALAEEVRPHNIMVQNLNTYYVVTKMSGIAKPTVMVPTVSTYVHSVLNKVGLPCGAALSDRPDTVTPYWGHALLDYVIHVIGWKGLFISYFHRKLNNSRRAQPEQEAKQQ